MPGIGRPNFQIHHAIRSQINPVSVNPVQPASEEPLRIAVPLQRNELNKILDKLGYRSPTRIQSKAIPKILKGESVLVESFTGTGKTIAYALPLLKMVRPAGKPQAVVIVPNEMLVQKIYAEFHRLKTDPKVRVAMGYASRSPNIMGLQKQELQRGADILIVTPGRLHALMDELPSVFRDIRVEFVVLDEARFLLQNAASVTDALHRLGCGQRKPQMVLVSATGLDDNKALTPFLRDPLIHLCVPPDAEKTKINQRFYRMPDDAKMNALLKIYQWTQQEKFVILCAYRGDKDNNKRDGVLQVSQKLRDSDCPNERLVGNFRSEKEHVLLRFTRQQFRVLVATHPLDEGIDFRFNKPGKPIMNGIVNFNFPILLEYQGQLGRTGRAGESAWMISLIADSDIPRFRNFQRTFNGAFELSDFPWDKQTADF